ncbi:MAG: heme-binding protein [Isosphaeraceae bacterium]
MSTALGILLVAPLASAQTAAPGQGAVTTRSKIRDAGSLFSSEAVRTAESALSKLEAKTRLVTTIQSVESLRGESPSGAMDALMKRADVVGLFVLVSGKDRHLELKVSPALVVSWPRARLDAVRDAFLSRFKTGRFDEGLQEGVKAIAAAVEANVSALNALGADQAVGGSREAPLVQRNQVRLTLAGARRVLAGAEAKASALGLKVNIAVVDDGGHLLTFARMDGARPASGYTALTKATTAATFRRATGPLNQGSLVADPLLNLSLQNAAAVSGGKITTLQGGLPIEVDGQVIGGRGRGGWLRRAGYRGRPGGHRSVPSRAHGRSTRFHGRIREARPQSVLMRFLRVKPPL